MDCEGASQVLLHRELRTLSSAEEADLHAHLDGCAACRAQAEHTREDRKHAPPVVVAPGADITWRPVVQLPASAVAAGARAMLPAIDPVVFDIDLEIAAGGMGRISKAHDRRLGREVAIKEVLEPRMRARFEREAMITARLQHPAIVPVYEAGTFPSGNPFYTMRLVWGGTLGSAIDKTKSMPERLALLPHVLAVTDALAYAHAHRIIHRDLKPGNVLVGEFGETVVIDWGLAKELGEDTDVAVPAGGQTTVVSSPPGLTRVGSVLGTPGFMSPEQSNGDAIDERGDVYALGAILYNLLAGDPPYYDRGGTAGGAKRRPPYDDPGAGGSTAPPGATQIIAAALEGPPTPIAQRAPNAPADLRAIVEKAMARDKADRYPTAKEMAEELRRFTAGQLIAREYTLRELAARWIAKHRTAVVVGAIAAVALAMVAVIAFVNVSRSRRDEAAAARAAEDAQKLAERERDNARKDAAALQEEQGLRELGQGDSSRALAYLAAAYREKQTANTGLHYLLTAASQDLARPAQVIVRPGKAVAFAGDKLAMVGERSITVGGTEESFGREVFAGKSYFDPTGASVAIELTRGREQRIEMWDVAAEKPRWRHASIAAGHVVFDAAGQRAAISHRDGIAVHDVSSGAVIAQLPSPGVESVALDTEHVVACGGDGHVRVWSMRDPKLAPQVLGEHCTLVALLDMGRLVYATTRLKLVRWTINKDVHDDLMSGHLAIKAIAVNKPKSLIAIGDATGVVMWDWKGKALGESREVQGGIDKLAFSADGSFLVGAGSDDRVFVWDTPSFHLRQAFGGGRGRIEAIAIDPDKGKRIAVLTAEEAQVWATPVGRLRRYVPGTGFVVAGTQLVARHGGGITLHSLVEDKQRSLAEGTIETLFANDKLIVLVGEHGAVMQFEPPLGTPVGVLRAADPTRIAEDAPHLVIEYDANHARVRSIATDAEVALVSLPEPARGHAISPDGKLLALIYARSIEQWNLDTGTRVSVDELPDKHGYVARYAAAAHRLVLYSSHRGAIVLDGGVKYELHTGAVQHAAISADGSRVALGVDNTVQLWDAVAGRKAPLYPPISATIPKAFALDATGDLLATGSVDGQVRIWDAQGRLLDRLVASQSGITKLAFAMSDTRLVALSKDNTIAVWDVHIDRRPAADIAKLVADRGSWELVDGKLSLRSR